jgi:hypothetical protein
MKNTITFGCLLIFYFAAAQPVRQLENIAAFNKLYGYVKYFHPSDEAASLDWDRFAIYGADEVQKCTDSISLQRTLISLFKPIAPAIQIFSAREARAFPMAALIPSDTTGYKVVTWQHVGLGSGNSRSVYNSARINRKRKPTDAQMFSTITAHIDLEKYRNKQFKLSARVRLIDGPGTAHLWARVDRPEGQIGFFDNMQDRPIASHQWRDYGISGVVDGDASSLAFGCFLMGAGKLMVDDLNLSILDEGEWKSVYTNTFESEVLDAFPESMAGTRAPDTRRGSLTRKWAEENKASLFRGSF